MSTPNASNDIVFYWYKFSPYGRRVAWYLALRNIEYAECLQPPILPRPDQTRLGVNYRRSPILAIGRDVYLDTRLIIEKLEERFPPSAQHPVLSSKGTDGLAGLLQKFAVDVSVFRQAAGMIPVQFMNKAFQKDRATFFPRDPKQDPVLVRAETTAHLRQSFDIMEALLADGREWVGNTEKPSLADLEGVWPFDWFVNDLKPPQAYFSEQLYPNVYGWIKRFKAAVNAAKAKVPKATSLNGDQAAQLITAAEFSDKDLVVDSDDPLQLRDGTMVEVFPLDGGGFTHQDRGRLVKLTKNEVGIVVQAETGQDICIHAPRWQFRIREIKGGARL